MGYYTRHTITIEFGNQDLLPALAHKISSLSEQSFCAEDGEIIHEGVIKWYESTEQLMKISSLEPFSSLLILVYGEGEEQGDIWKEYFMNGKCQRLEGKIVFPEFKTFE